MGAARIITVEVPEELLERAQRASGKDIADTVREGLELIARDSVYAQLRALRGKVHFSQTWEQLKDDR